MDEAIKVFMIMAAVVGGPLLAVMLVPALAKSVAGWFGTPAKPARVDGDFQAQVLQELQGLRQEVAELAERVDFTERMLAKGREAERIPPGR
jgi:hypothetical protein